MSHGTICTLRTALTTAAFLLRSGNPACGQEIPNGFIHESDGGAAQSKTVGSQVQSDYLPGNVMEPWEGGPEYFSRWSSGPSADKSHFPIAVWLQSPENTATALTYKSIGINTHIGLWEGPTEKQLSAVSSLSTTTICDQNSAGLHSANNGVIKAWMHQDEPDNAQGNTQDPVPVSQVVARYNEMKSNDLTRPVYVNFGQGVACDAWYGRGNRTNHPEDYAAYSEGADILSFDIYPMNVFPLPNSAASWFRAFHNAVAQNPWFVASGVENLRKWTNHAKPVWAWIECTNIQGDSRYALTPSIVKSEVWMAIIHGARGIGYFCHQFSPSFIEAGLLANPQMRDAVSAINGQIGSLAPVLNTQTVANGVATVSGNPAVGVDAMVKRSGGCTYLFAVAMRPGKTTATFTLRDFTGNTAVEAIGENRNFVAGHGVFQDEFSDYGVHIYRFQNPGTSGIGERSNSKKTGFLQNYPNPFNLSTRIEYSIPGGIHVRPVTLKIFNLLGGEVATLVDEVKPEGNYHVQFDPDRYGLPSGIFVYHLQTEKTSYCKKMIYIK